MPAIPKPEQVTPVQAVANTTPVVAVRTGCEQYKTLIEQYDWDARIAYAIMLAENRSCNPSADNSGLNKDGTNDVGLFQVNSIHVDSGLITEEGRRTPAINIATAYKIYEERNHWDVTGWNAWSVFKSGKYLENM